MDFCSLFKKNTNYYCPPAYLLHKGTGGAIAFTGVQILGRRHEAIEEDRIDPKNDPL